MRFRVIRGAGDDAAQQVAQIEQVRGYWEGLRRPGRLPARVEIDPRGIEAALSGAFLIERLAPGIARLRVAGQALAELMAMEPRGMPLSALFGPSERLRLGVVLENLFQRGEIQLLTLCGEGGFLSPDLTARMILLPLAEDRTEGRGLPMALGCLAHCGATGHRPRRLRIRHVSAEPTQPLPFLSGAPARVAELAEATPGYAVKPTASSRPWLQLVDLAGR